MKRKLKWLFDRNFLKDMLPLAFPIALQNLLMCSFRLVDTLMIGRLGDTAIASVGLAGQISFFVETITFGLATGASVFISQYHGANNRDGILRAFGATVLFSLPIGLAVAALAFLAPERVMAVLTDDPALIETGAQYVRYACFSYLGITIYNPLAVVLRSTENVRVPMVTSITAAVTNAVLNYCLIFGKLGLPEMGVAGAGLATAVSALLNPLLMLIISFAEKNVLCAPIKKFFDLPRAFLKEYWYRVLPALGNEGAWGVSVLIINMIFGRMGADNYAALTVFRTVENIVFVFFIGICNACSILVGKRVGMGDVSGAKDYSKRFFLLVPIIGVVLGAAIISLRMPVLSLFDISGQARHTAAMLMIFYGFEVSLRNVPYIGIVGVFRGGGDTKFGLFADAFCEYVVAIPISFVLGILLKAPFLTTYIAMILVDDAFKVTFVLVHYIRMKWIKPVRGVPGETAL